MTRHNLLFFARKWPLWLALIFSIAALFLSVAFLNRAAADNEAQIDRAYEDMTVTFELGPGRTHIGSDFTIDLKKMVELTGELSEYYTDFSCNAPPFGSWMCILDPAGGPLVTRMTDQGLEEDPRIVDGQLGSEYARVLSFITVWDASDIRVLEGGLGEGFWLSEATAQTLGVTAGDTLYAVKTETWSGRVSDRGYPVAAIVEGATDYVDGRTYDQYNIWLAGNQSRALRMTELRFTLKKEHNSELREIYDELQKLLNNRAVSRDLFVSVHYNSKEIDGVLNPLLAAQRSAEFLAKLCSVLLPVLSYALLAVGAISFSNEIGVRRLTGETRAAVFFSSFLPIAAAVLLGFLLTGAVCLFLGLLPHVEPAGVLIHLGAMLGLCAAVIGAETLFDPLLLLRGLNHE